MKPIFITGIGTGVGKTLVSAIVAEALGASYWKPVQAGYEDGTDAQWVAGRIGAERVLPEAFRLEMPASPHIAARREGVHITVEELATRLPPERPLVVEGAGGLLVPLNEQQTMADLALRLDAVVILVSRNYLGSINHSLLTAEVCKIRRLRVAGWVFNDRFGHYEQDIVRWSGLPMLASVPFRERPDGDFVRAQAMAARPALAAAVGW
ncbi:MAG TPA: dethiobiotin synthase [Puia sp.]|nr:dethiobiotin synthase [Puia sp.]